ncbi:MAG TPA: hypothetical protein VF898_13990 [Chloroflexota bacterium]
MRSRRDNRAPIPKGSPFSLSADELSVLLEEERCPRSATYDPVWLLRHQLRPNVLWLAEFLCEVMELMSIGSFRRKYRVHTRL